MAPGGGTPAVPFFEGPGGRKYAARRAHVPEAPAVQLRGKAQRFSPGKERYPIPHGWITMKILVWNSPRLLRPFLKLLIGKRS